jgi:hypothetical protein
MPYALAFSVAFFGFSKLRNFNEAIPTSHKIAILGLPGAGKTTLITALFEAIQKGTGVPNARLHGLNTISVVNRYIAKLNGGERVGPTRESDIFVFRFSYLKRDLLFRRSYDVEIADFPGEYSGQISSSESFREEFKADGLPSLATPGNLEEFDYVLFHKEFFSWIASSREYLFVIDLSAIYSSVNPRKSIAEMAARIRTSWQVIEDATSERGVGSIRNRAVTLVFTKTDSLIPAMKGNVDLWSLLDSDNSTSPPLTNELAVAGQSKQVIADGGEANNLAITRKESSDLLQRIVLANDYAFRDMISFFRGRTRRFSIAYTSMVISDPGGGRLGVMSVLKKCLP